jgi:hypothetical protein
MSALSHAVVCSLRPIGVRFSGRRSPSLRAHTRRRGKYKLCRMTRNTRRQRSTHVSFRIGRPDPLIIVQGMVNGAGPLNFAVDTGASMSVITPAAARRSGITGGKPARAHGAHGSMNATVSRLRSLRIGEIEVRSLQVAVVSLATLNRQTRLNLGGIIGYNFLRRYLVTIDYPRRTIAFRGLPSNEPPRLRRRGRTRVQP